MRPSFSRLAAAVLAASVAAAAAPADPLSGPPPGFRAVFEDGRSNAHRGPRRAAGDALTERIWSRGVPRRAAPLARPSGHGAEAAGGPPRGYAYAFGDGRLNPDRGPGTAAGAARMGRIWTDTVPRRVRPGARAGY